MKTWQKMITLIGILIFLGGSAQAKFDVKRFLKEVSERTKIIQGNITNGFRPGEKLYFRLDIAGQTDNGDEIPVGKSEEIWKEGVQTALAYVVNLAAKFMPTSSQNEQKAIDALKKGVLEYLGKIRSISIGTNPACESSHNNCEWKRKPWPANCAKGFRIKPGTEDPSQPVVVCATE